MVQKHFTQHCRNMFKSFDMLHCFSQILQTTQGRLTFRQANIHGLQLETLSTRLRQNYWIKSFNRCSLNQSFDFSWQESFSFLKLFFPRKDQIRTAQERGQCIESSLSRKQSSSMCLVERNRKPNSKCTGNKYIACLAEKSKDRVRFRCCLLRTPAQSWLFSLLYLPLCVSFILRLNSSKTKWRDGCISPRPPISTLPRLRGDGTFNSPTTKSLSL